RLTAFAFIWLALAVYSFDAWRSLRRLPQPG
ncbi:EamA family transporter, partial [Pseudomonas aeruginosa]|nr:EamA family transporter [Pseudomonas aeruginosa]